MTSAHTPSSSPSDLNSLREVYVVFLLKKMETRDLVQCGNVLQVHFDLKPDYTGTRCFTFESYDYIINDSANFKVKVISSKVVQNGSWNTTNTCLIFICFTKLRPDDELTYTASVLRKALGITNKFFTSDDGTWHLIYEQQIKSFDVKVVTEVSSASCSFATLHVDTELTDFELRGEDGSVQMHKAVLAASSPALRRMLSGTWKETTEGHVDIPGISQLTLQQLKDYLYLGSLPDKGLEQLLLLSSCYMMPDLEQRCADKLVSELTAQNTCELLAFSVKHNLTRLMLAILEWVQGGMVQVKNIRKHVLKSNEHNKRACRAKAVAGKKSKMSS